MIPLSLTEQDPERLKLYENDKGQQRVKKDLYERMAPLSEPEKEIPTIQRFHPPLKEFPSYKTEKDKIHSALSERSVERIDFSSPFYQNLDTAMRSINQVGKALGQVEEVAGKAIDIACNTPITSDFCAVVGSTANVLGNAAASAIPNSVKEGAEALTTHLEKNGIPRETTHETGLSLLRIGSFAAGGVWIGKGMKSIPKPKYPLAGRLNNVAKKNDSSFFFTRETKSAAALATYTNALKNERMLLPTLEKLPINRPAHLPNHLGEFYANSNVHSFRLDHLGPQKNGILEAHLLYSDNGLFLIKSSAESYAIAEKLHTTRLLESSHLYWDQRLGYVLDQIKHVAQEKGFESIYLAWDPQKHAVLTTLTNRSESILSTTTLSTGIHSTPLTVVEIALP